MTEFWLRVIALVSMFIDHLWKFDYFAYYSHKGVFSANWEICYYIGRLAFPIFAFQIVQGYYHTKNLKKYYLRLFILALLTEIPFSMMINYKIIDLSYQNVVWALLCGLFTIHILDKIIKSDRDKFLKIILQIAVILVAYYFGNLVHFDYDGGGILIILTFFYAKLCPKKIFKPIIQILALSFVFIIIYNDYTLKALAPLMSLPILWAYNGKLGYTSKIWRDFCYSFYPVHMVIIILIRYFMYRYGFSYYSLY